MRWRAIVRAFLVAASSAACARVPVYQRSSLAHPALQSPLSPTVQAADQHMLEVREGSRGGSARVGGGCGCN